ncbi:pyridoxal-phosphate dependent enzyme [bacterium]|nr:pyridoxal-phosphate dependent enzyme [bacterium]
MIEKLSEANNWLLMGGRAPGGSLKHVLMDRLIPSDLPAQSLVADLSAGLAAVALAEVAEARNLRCRAYVPPNILPVYLEALRKTSAEVVITGSLESALQELRTGHDSQELFWTRQNYSDCDAYGHLTPSLGVDHLVAGVGTGCALRCFGAHLRARNPRLQVHAVYAAVSGLRPPGLALDLPGLPDVGSPAYLQQRLPGLQVHTVEAPDSTAAVLQVLKDLKNALGVSVDQR